MNPSPSVKPERSPSTTPSAVGSMLMSSYHLSPSPATSLPCHDDDAIHLRKVTHETQGNMRRRYQPYRPRVVPPALEHRFACRSIGDTSYSDLGFEDVVDGKRILLRGLSHFSNSIVQKAYIAKSKFRDTILRRVKLCQANIDATNSRMELYHEMMREAKSDLQVADQEMQWFKHIMGIRGIDEDDLAFHHAAYADELVALTIADTQLDQMADVLPVAATDKASDSGESDTGLDDEDDLVYRDGKSIPLA